MGPAVTPPGLQFLLSISEGNFSVALESRVQCHPPPPSGHSQFHGSACPPLLPVLVHFCLLPFGRNPPQSSTGFIAFFFVPPEGEFGSAHVARRFFWLVIFFFSSLFPLSNAVRSLIFVCFQPRFFCRVFSKALFSLHFPPYSFLSVFSSAEHVGVFGAFW